MKKVCSNCKIEKPIEMFYRDRHSPSGRRADCAECNKEKVKKYHKLHEEEKKIYCKQYREKNYLLIKERQRQHYLLNKDKINLKRRKRYQNDSEYKLKILSEVKEYRKNSKNKEKIRQSKKILAEKYKKNPEWRLLQNLRRRMLHVLQGNRKDNYSLKMIGCTRKDLVRHLENLFKPGMNWNNYGKRGWHIDHIIPCKSFDLSNPEEQKKCFHYTNLQPLWWHENLSKGAKTI